MATSSSKLPNDNSGLEPSATNSTTSVSPTRTMVDCQDEFLNENDFDEVMEESVPTDSIEPPEPPKALLNDHDYLRWPNESDQTSDQTSDQAAMPISQNGFHNSAFDPYGYYILMNPNES